MELERVCNPPTSEQEKTEKTEKDSRSKPKVERAEHAEGNARAWKRVDEREQSAKQRIVNRSPQRETKRTSEVFLTVAIKEGFGGKSNTTAETGRAGPRAIPSPATPTNR
jgi:hypothetical protein